MNPNIPSLASALQHALAAAVAVLALAAAALQLARGELGLASADLLIAAVVGHILHLGVGRHGRVLSNFFVRRRVGRLSDASDCVWCGERIERGDSAVVYRGVVNGQRYAHHHHPECDHATRSWHDSADDDEPRPPAPGTMQRGRTRPRRLR